MFWTPNCEILLSFHTIRTDLCIKIAIFGQSSEQNFKNHKLGSISYGIIAKNKWLKWIHIHLVDLSYMSRLSVITFGEFARLTVDFLEIRAKVWSLVTIIDIWLRKTTLETNLNAFHSVGHYMTKRSDGFHSPIAVDISRGGLCSSKPFSTLNDEFEWMCWLYWVRLRGPLIVSGSPVVVLRLIDCRNIKGWNISVSPSI